MAAGPLRRSVRPLESFDFFPRKLYAEIHISSPMPHILICISKMHRGGTIMSEDKTILPMPDRGPVPHGPDLDDLIFQNEGWLTSDR